MNFVVAILPTSLNNSLADVKIFSVKNSMVLEILEILSEVIFMMLLVMSISIQVHFWHGFQIVLLEFSMRPTAVNV